MPASLDRSYTPSAFDPLTFRRIRNYVLLGCVLALFVTFVFHLGSTIVSLFKAESTDIVNSVVFISSNDVYKLVGMPETLTTYSWVSGDLSRGKDKSAFRKFVARCQGADEGSCFPMHGGLLLGFNTMILPNVSWMHQAPGCLSIDNYKKQVAPTTLYGGLKSYGASLKYLASSLSGEHSKVINIHAGDFLGPSYSALEFKGDQLVQMMNHAGVDIAVPGNHDFDFRLAGLEKQMSSSSFLWLNANVRDSIDNSTFGSHIAKTHSVRAAGTAPPKPASYKSSAWLANESNGHVNASKTVAVRDFFGKRICIFGTTGLSGAVASLRKDKTKRAVFTDDVEHGLQVLREIHKHKYGVCDLVIAITHVRTGRDLNFYDRATREGLHMDAIIGGHDHYISFMHLTYDGRHTYLLKGGSDGHILSQLTFRFESGTVVGKLEWVPVVEGSCENVCNGKDMSEAWTGCSTWMASADELVQTYASNVINLRRHKIPWPFSGLYDTANARVHETRAINLWLDVLRTGAQADVALLCGGDIRQEAYVTYPAGSLLSELDLREEFPFNSPQFIVIDIPVGALLPAVEHSMHLSCGTLVNPSKAYFSGIETIYREKANSTSGCELVAVRYYGHAHVAGIKDMRIEQFRSAKDVDKILHDLQPGDYLFKDGNTYNENAILRMVMPRYLISLGQASRAGREAFVDPLRLAAKVAKQQAACKKKDSPPICSDGKPTADFYTNQISAEQAPASQSRYKMLTKSYEWSRYPQLRPVEIPEDDDITKDTFHKLAWEISPEKESSMEFWKERNVTHNVFLDRSHVENMPVFRFLDEDVLTEPKQADSIIMSWENRGEAHQADEDGNNYVTKQTDVHGASLWLSYVRRLAITRGPGPRNTLSVAAQLRLHRLDRSAAT